MISQRNGRALADALDAGNVKGSVTLDAENLLDSPAHQPIGQITGSVYPDRAIVFTAHQDAWFTSAADDSVGVGMILAIAKAAIDSGYRPGLHVDLRAGDGRGVRTRGRVLRLAAGRVPPHHDVAHRVDDRRDGRAQLGGALAALLRRRERGSRTAWVRGRLARVEQVGRTDRLLRPRRRVLLERRIHVHGGGSARGDVRRIRRQLRRPIPHRLRRARHAELQGLEAGPAGGDPRGARPGRHA